MGGYTYVSPEQKARDDVRKATDRQKQKLLQERADELTAVAKAGSIARILDAKYEFAFQWTPGSPSCTGPHWLLYGLTAKTF